MAKKAKTKNKMAASPPFLFKFLGQTRGMPFSAFLMTFVDQPRWGVYWPNLDRMGGIPQIPSPLATSGLE